MRASCFLSAQFKKREILLFIAFWQSHQFLQKNFCFEKFLTLSLDLSNMRINQNMAILFYSILFQIASSALGKHVLTFVHFSECSKFSAEKRKEVCRSICTKKFDMLLKYTGTISTQASNLQKFHLMTSNYIQVRETESIFFAENKQARFGKDNISVFLCHIP